MGRKNLKKRTSLVPLKRMASTNEISNAVIFLCSEKSTFITSILDVKITIYLLMHNSKYDFQTYISLVNSIILTLYILNFDLPTGSWLFDILVITLLLSFLSIFRSRFKNFFFRLMNIFQLPILTIILFFLV